MAELIDNSIQAREDLEPPTIVEVLCVDRVELVQQRQRRRIDRIAVYDNASGMDAATLRMALQFGNGTHLVPEKQRGIGKFGMGLPNASISQCRKVEVWTWQGRTCLYSYLDVDQIEKGKLREVPEPREEPIPEFWIDLIQDEIGPHGTLVVWSQLDRVSWKSSKALIDNAEFLIGRIYRYFIHDGKARIRLAAFQEKDGELESYHDRLVRANDPLYLMKGTCAPEPFDQEPAFDFVGEEIVTVNYQGKDHNVILRYSVAKPVVRQPPHGGSSAIGRHAAKNQGVSVVRARRELELNRSFDNSYDPRERWWGVEVIFEPELDDLFGVTNNKQAATAFMQLDLDEDAKHENLTPGEYRERLEEANDPRLAMYEISAKIQRILNRTLRPQIQRMREGTRKGGEIAPPPGSAEEIATRATRRLRQAHGDKGRSDQDEKLPQDRREQELEKELIAEGVPEQQAKEIAVAYVRSNIKFLFQEAEIPGPVIFDVKSKAGMIIININTRHPAREHLFELLRQENPDSETPALKALKLLLSAWARLEDEAGQQRRQQLEDIRQDWGRLARDFLQAAYE
ncbi:MAG: ATP-binding protein [Gemmataceae bacterium]|nr:ATP-binding protein [Gemmataceae bacterium]MDW8244364.1 ATP-binding protein [Thermogemmata sp.]